MNAISILQPYQHAGMWVFDDPDKGLCKEPFVSGIDVMISRITERIPDAKRGFRLLFSATPFPGYDIKLEWRRSEYGGNWYYCARLDMEGWLCPALFRYFDEAQPEVYAKAEAEPSKTNTGGN